MTKKVLQPLPLNDCYSKPVAPLAPPKSQVLGLGYNANFDKINKLEANNNKKLNKGEKMKLTKQKLGEMYEHINILLKSENGFKFNCALIQNKKILTPLIKKIRECMLVSEKERIALCAEYCEKGKNGKSLFQERKNERVYKGLEKGTNEEFDKKIRKLEESRNVYLEEKSEIEFHHLDAKHLPEKLNGVLLESIMAFVDMENTSDNKVDKSVKTKLKMI